MTITSTPAAIAVVAGVLRDERGRVLLARRPEGKQHAGLWEFPGGKLEQGEDALVALTRELDEELGIDVRAARPLMSVPHGPIVLDAWEVVAWSGRPNAREAQAISWVDASAIDAESMPPADRPVLTALRLPDRYLVTPDVDPADDMPFLAGLERALGAGIRLVDLRLPDAPRERVAPLARMARELCRKHEAKLLLHADWMLAEVLGLDGVQLPAAIARRLDTRPLPASRLVGVSCHDEDELEHAARIGADFATLAPVLPTASHPGAPVLGWDAARALITQARLPVYALGGLGSADIATARAGGAQGIAAIRALWS
ncbi:Nudix family hydrolase [Dokdonella sp.]|uniref:Nudix family hydrolase n=1 Tax=Dokdonella sp. TaxID=2291710 RepID=UPI0025BC1AD8|nr:Nudix family hydrolase [Dokdonella sp.]MBX3690833.1 Nudix family hydrolase [Dokdonella sp.]MCW5568523.1 Nudix family hydrolase [Dokdonella sp.]